MTAPWIVCAWHTPSYRVWAFKLIASLNAVGAPHDIVEVPKLPGSWEDNTMAKPAQLLAAMDRHPDKAIVFLDVDCLVRGDLSPLAAINGDVGRRVVRHRGGQSDRTRHPARVGQPRHPEDRQMAPAAAKVCQRVPQAGRSRRLPTLGTSPPCLPAPVPGS
jgi:hypothetical protein